jgi:hypothetical protein
MVDYRPVKKIIKGDDSMECYGRCKSAATTALLIKLAARDPHIATELTRPGAHLIVRFKYQTFNPFKILLLHIQHTIMT